MRVLCSFCFLVIVAVQADAQRLMEQLDRGVVAVNDRDGGVFVSWRLLGTEPRDLAFDVYRQTEDAQPVKLNNQLLTGATHFRDLGRDVSRPTRYIVRPAGDDAPFGPEGSFELHANAPQRNYLTIPLQTPPGYHANDASPGDLDGDGRFELIVHLVGRGRDNSQSGLTTEPLLHAYDLDGRLLWTINLGKNIREGAHYTQFLVYDFDGDGRAEVVCRTADGTVDGQGQVIGDPGADHRQLPEGYEADAPPERTESATQRRERPRRRGEPRIGYVLRGPEYLTVFDGQTGAALATTDYIPPRHPETSNPSPEQLQAVWGDGYGNRVDRFLACVAYLDGERPSLVMSRGYYTRTVVAAWDWRDGRLTQRWVFDSDELEKQQTSEEGEASPDWSGQGNHSVAVADVDEDGRDEIIFGAMVIDDEGSGLYSTGLGHGDAQHTSDLDPTRRGLETWSIHEHVPENKPGAELRNARTGEIYFAAAHGRDVARGLAADIDPRHEGCELWGGSNRLWSVKGEEIGRRPRSTNMAIWWDGDLLRELLGGVDITKWHYKNAREVTLLDGRAEGLAANNGSKANPCLSADLFGDWREELVARTRDSRELRIYTTTIPTEHRLFTLMHDATYRLSVAWQNVGYNQPPHPGFFLGHGMSPMPRPAIKLVEPVKSGSASSE